MIKWIDKQLQQQRSRVFIRVGIWSGIAVCIGISLYISNSASQTNSVQNIYRDYFTLSDSISRMQKNNLDSLLLQSQAAIRVGILDGWNQAAEWLEKTRKLGIQHGLNCTYVIDSINESNTGLLDLKRLSAKFSLSSNQSNFNAIHNFLKELSSDTTLMVRLQKIEFIGDGSNLSKTSVSVIGWIHL